MNELITLKRLSELIRHSGGKYPRCFGLVSGPDLLEFDVELVVCHRGPV